MKKTLLASILILLLSASTCFAIGFSKAIVARSSPGTDSNSLKTWEDEWMMAEGDSVQIDINLSDVPEPLITAGVLIEFDPSEVNIVSADINSGDGAWDQGMSNIIYRDGGTIVITAGNLSTVSPDENGDISIANIQFECVNTCDGSITIKTVPGFDSVVGNSSGVYDDDISPNYFDFVSTTTTTPIDIKPKQVWKSRLIPLPYLMLITGEEISKESFVDLSYDPSESLLSLPPIVLSKSFILSFIWVMPGMEDQTVTASVITENGVSEDQFDILAFGPFPKPSFASISPDTGEQESTITSVSITSVNTSFENDGVTNVIFSPEGNIIVNSFSVQSNTELECDITIAANAEVGDYSVTVSYDGGTKFIAGTNVFEVLDTTPTTVPTTTTTTDIFTPSNGDVFPPPSSPEAMDCGDGVVDENDVTELIDILLGQKESTDCQLMKADLPNGMPPYCGNPAGSDNCETDGDVDEIDLLVIIDLALGKTNCYSFCEFGEIF